MAEKHFDSLEKLAKYFEKSAILQVEALAAVAGYSAHLLKEKADHIYGDSAKLADLAQATQDERQRLGYTANDPLLRTGKLLRDSVEPVHQAGPTEAIAGIATEEPIVAYHEFGYVNARTGNAVPARPVMMIAVEEALPEVEAAVHESVEFAMGFNPQFKALADRIV